MHRIFRVKAYEKEHGPHFNEEYARKAVMKMENEDGTRGPHWSLEETTTLASQYGIALGSKFNRYDWFVALNMVYSDYYRVIMNITGSNNTKHYVEFAKAWLNDKDIDEGKMWYYYIYVMCDHIREAEMECYEEKMSKYEDESGIPVLRTTGVVTTSTEVRYDVNYADYRSLPNEGLFFLDVRQASPTASASLPVGLSDSESDNTTQSLLRNALQEDVQAGDLQVNFRYLIYYNKCNNTYQLVNAYPANIATPGA